MACANFKPPHFFRRVPDNESVLAKGGHGLLAGRIGNRQNGEMKIVPVARPCFTRRTRL